ncbi:MAG: phosphoglucomutase/phosphomannomutase family protein [Flavobacteriales bacterium]|nr:phosphoglucomutase/phosphomannomutase family protein [Flavobacteriales bacterium]MCB9166384.1 phosphoglucomutase/phosphomannomutase family protein [Flavobacteriales bacterium]
MSKIKFGTDGWRAIIAEEFTVDNVVRVSQAVATWVKREFPEDPSIVVGHDCRFAGELFASAATKVFLHEGITVHLARGFVSTPMVSLGTVRLGASLGVIITASHNPPAYNGYKLKGSYGGPLVPEHVQEIEDMIPGTHRLDLGAIDLGAAEKEGRLKIVGLEDMYVEHVKASFDLETIHRSGLRLGYDAMYGAGQHVIPRVLPDTVLLHCENDPSFKGQAPEPIHKNLVPFSDLIKREGIDCGLATDGDADRIGLYNGRGEFVDSHHIILLLIHYLVKYKKMTGKVVVAFSTTPKVGRMCEHYGLEHQVVKIGFKWICGIMIKEDVLLGGEESGGIAIKGHIPERDGIWMGLTLWEFMAKSGKSLEELIAEVYAIVGPFSYERNDLHITEALKQEVLAKCQADAFTRFGDLDVRRVETIDGYKYYFDNDQWLMIRASGTEPVLRTYAESDSLENARAILEACRRTIGA